MKNINLLTISILLLTLNISAQTDITLKINHLLGEEIFAFNKTVTAPGEYSVNVTRLEYYISQIKLVHDGGKIEVLSEKYFLVNGASLFSSSLGNFNISKLEEIRFSIGVDNLPNTNPNDNSTNTTNHADPSLWFAGHPLSPKSPSMHWGWTSGYRFVALEGKTGLGAAYSYEIHALGDRNYNEVSIPTVIEASGGELNIELDANYLNSLKDVDVSSGLIEHGSTGQAIPFLKNFQTEVFSVKGEQKDSTVSVQENGELFKFTIGPNPSNGLNLKAYYNLVSETDYRLSITDLNGKIVEQVKLSGSSINLTDLSPGIYVVNVLEEGVSVYSQKAIVTR